MGKHKRKIIAALVIFAVLVGAWFMGSALIVGGEDAPALAGETSLQAEADAADDPFADSDLLLLSGNTSGSARNPETSGQAPPATEAETPNENMTPENTNNDPDSLSPSQETESASPSPTPRPSPTPAPSPTPTTPPTDARPDDALFYVTLSVRVDTILRNMHLLDREKHELIPSDGVIFPATRVRVAQGESVFDVLQREMRRGGIHMSSRFTPAFNSAYVEAINNIFEFDVGPLSGWMYRVNGIFPNFGSSQYILASGDVIEWVYTVDLGRDVGGAAAFR